MDLQKTLENHESTLLNVIDCDPMFLTRLKSTAAINQKSYEDIRCKPGGNVSRNELLLSTLKSNRCGDTFTKLLQALTEDSQEHVGNLLDSRPGSQPLSAKSWEKITMVLPRAAGEINVTAEFLAELRINDTILERHKEYVTRPAPQDHKGINLIDIMLRRSNRAWEHFYFALNSCGQEHVVDILKTDCDAIIPVHVKMIGREDDSVVSNKLNWSIASRLRETVLNPIFSKLKSLGLSIGGSLPSGSIRLFLVCDDIESLTKLNELEMSDDLKKDLQEWINAVIAPDLPVEITVKVMEEDYKRCRQHFLKQSPISHFVREKEKLIKQIQNCMHSTSYTEPYAKELQQIQDENDIDHLTIGIVGRMGLGKSSLLNALHGQGDILPTSGGGLSCTTKAVKICSSNNDNYEADITFFTVEEWGQEVENREAVLTDNPDSRLMSLPPYDADIICNCDSKISCIRKEDFIEKVTPFISKAKHLGPDILPYVKLVLIRIPNSLILRSMSFIDMPGYGEYGHKYALSEKYNPAIKECKSIWIVTDVMRAADDGTQDLITENVCRKLVMEGRTDAVSFICTKTDNNLDDIKTYMNCDGYKEYKEKIDSLERDIRKKESEEKQLKTTVEKDKCTFEQLKLEKEKTNIERDLRRFCALIRNKKCQDSLKDDLKKMVEKIVGNDRSCIQDQSKDISVFCICSKEYIKLKENSEAKTYVFTKLNDTGIPELLHYIEGVVNEKISTFKNKQIRKLCWLLKQIVHSMHMPDSVEANSQPDLKTAVTKQKHLLEENLKAILDGIVEEFSENEKKLSLAIRSGVKDAKLKAADACMQWSSFHANTYTAIIRRQGEFISSSTRTEYDFNEDLIRPFTDNILCPWTALFNIPFKNFIRKILDTLKEHYDSLGTTLSQLKQPFCTTKLPEFTAFQIKSDIYQIKLAVQQNRQSIFRDMKSSIKSEMEPAYDHCRKLAETRLQGKRDAMSTYVTDHVEKRRKFMFEKIGDQVMRQMDEVKKLLNGKLRDCCDRLILDFSCTFEPVFQQSSQLDPSKENRAAILECIQPLRSLHRHISPNFNSGQFPELDELCAEVEKTRHGMVVKTEAPTCSTVADNTKAAAKHLSSSLGSSPDDDSPLAKQIKQE